MKKFNEMTQIEINAMSEEDFEAVSPLQVGYLKKEAVMIVDIFGFIKNLGLRYRVSTGVVFSEFKTSKSLVGYISHQSYLCV